MYTFGDDAMENLEAGRRIRRMRCGQHAYLDGMCELDGYTLSVEG
jgi:hypothetical protein